MASRDLIRLALLLPVLVCAGCAGAQRAEPANGAQPPRTTDNLCLNDCLGSGATRSFCEDRCTN